MRKLTPDEEHALAVLEKHGSYCPSFSEFNFGYMEGRVIRILDSLVRKKRAWREVTDGPPRYHPIA